MGQVLKFKYGGLGKQEQEAELTQNIQEYLNIYNSADLSTKNLLDSLGLTFVNYAQANPMGPRSKRHFDLEASRAMLEAAKTGKVPAYVNHMYSDKARWNSEPEIKSKVGYAISEFNKVNTPSSTTGQASPANTVTSSNSKSPSGGTYKLHRYGWNNGMDLGYMTTDNDLTSRMRSFASGLAKNLLNAIDALSRGEDVVLPKGFDIQGLSSLLSALQTLIAKLNNPEYQATNQDYNIIRNIAQNTGVDSDSFMSIFGDFIPKDSQKDINLRDLKSKGYLEFDPSELSEYTQALVKKHGYNFLKDKEGNIFAFDKNYNKLNSPLSHVNMDYRDTLYNQGLFTDEEGKIWTGDVTTLNPEDWGYEAYTKLRDDTKNLRTNLYHSDTYKYGRHGAGEDSELIDAIANSVNYKGKDFQWADVSQLFKGDLKVVAISPNGFTEDIYGNILFNDKTTFFTFDDNGNLVSKSLNDLKNDYRLEGFGEKSGQVTQIDYYKNLMDDAEKTTIDPDTDIAGRSIWENIGRGLWHGGAYGTLAGPYGTVIGGIAGAIGGAATYDILDNVSENPQWFFDNVLKAIKNPSGHDFDIAGHDTISNKEILSDFSYYTNRKDFLQFLALLVLKYNVHPTKEQMRFLGELYQNELREGSEKEITFLQEGGIIKAAKGATVDVLGNEVDDKKPKKPRESDIIKKRDDTIVKNAEELGYGTDVNRYMSNTEKVGMVGSDNSWSAADTLRIATVAQDVASIVASFAPGAGTGVAAGLGVTSLGTEFLADMMDDSVSSGQVAKNAAMNLGLAAIGMIPGAKVGKVITRLVKIAPKVLFAASALGIAMDDSTLATFAKLNDPSAKLTREDWKNIAHVTQLVAAGVRGGKQIAANRKVSKAIKNDAKPVIENLTIGLKNADGKDVILHKDYVKQIQEAVKKNDVITIDKIKQDLISKGATEESIKEVFKPKDISKWQAVKDKLTSLKKQGKKEELTDADKKDLSFAEIKAKDVQEPNLRLIDMLNEEQALVDKSWLSSRWFSNRFGGGTYTATQRAILRQHPELMQYVTTASGNPVRYYAGWNPLLDLKGKRTSETGLRWGTPLTKQGLTIPEGLKALPASTNSATTGPVGPASDVPKTQSTVKPKLKRKRTKKPITQKAETKTTNTSTSTTGVPKKYTSLTFSGTPYIPENKNGAKLVARKSKYNLDTLKAYK